MFFILLIIITRFLLMRRNVSRRAEFNLGTTVAPTNPVSRVSSESNPPRSMDGWTVSLNEQDAEVVEHDNAFADLTDLQNRRAFRYQY